MIAIWGANGFIGRHVAHKLIQSGNDLKLFARHFDALAGGVVLPAVIDAADLVAFDPAGVQHRATMGAATADEMRRAARTAKERQVLGQDTERHRPARPNRGRSRHRMPEPAQQFAHLGARRGLAQEPQFVDPR